MKIRPLPEIDLARIAPQSADVKRSSLEQMRFGRPPFSYAPTRSCYLDIFNVQPEMFGPVGATDWDVIEGKIKRDSKSDVEEAHNLRVARGLHDWVGGSILGRAQEFYPMKMRAGRRVTYWQQVILEVEKRPLVPFIDPRRSRGLTSEGRRFAFSMMHERIRAADEDYAEVQFGILQFGAPEGDRRHVKLHTDDGLELYSLDELEAMIASTYAIWADVCQERESEMRRKSGGERGPLSI